MRQLYYFKHLLSNKKRDRSETGDGSLSPFLTAAKTSGVDLRHSFNCPGLEGDREPSPVSIVCIFDIGVRNFRRMKCGKGDVASLLINQHGDVSLEKRPLSPCRHKLRLRAQRV